MQRRKSGSSADSADSNPSRYISDERESRVMEKFSPHGIFSLYVQRA